jgi:CarD family transcriptional regulator
VFDVGDKVVYPHHGAGTIVSKDVKLVLGEKREYLTIKILHNEMTVNVPVDNAEKVGLRGVIDQEMVDVVVKVLLGGSTEMPKNWNRRFKHNRDKMKTGDVLELAEVVRNLALRDHEKGLSTGEKQMYVKAKKILASELMYAKNMSEDDALEWLEETLTEGAKPKLTPAEKAAARKAPAAGKAAAPAVKKAAAPVAKKAAPAKKVAAAKPAAKAKSVAAATSTRAKSTPAKKPSAATKRTAARR